MQVESRIQSITRPASTSGAPQRSDFSASSGAASALMLASGTGALTGEELVRELVALRDAIKAEWLQAMQSS